MNMSLTLPRPPLADVEFLWEEVHFHGQQGHGSLHKFNYMISTWKSNHTHDQVFFLEIDGILGPCDAPGQAIHQDQLRIG